MTLDEKTTLRLNTIQLSILGRTGYLVLEIRTLRLLERFLLSGKIYRLISSPMALGLCGIEPSAAIANYCTFACISRKAIIKLIRKGDTFSSFAIRDISTRTKFRQSISPPLIFSDKYLI